MCMSFYDLPLTRQEEIWVETIGYAQAGSRHDSFWAYRRDAYERLLRETYAGMTIDALTTHKTELETAHSTDPDWAVVIDAVTQEIKTRAERGAML